MKASSFKYLLKQGVRSVWVNRLMSFASVGVLVACLLLIGSAVLLTENVRSVVGYIQAQNEMMVFLREDLTDEELAQVDAQIRGLDNLSDITFVSKEETLQKQKEQMGEAGAILEGYENDNPFLDSYVLKLRDVSGMQLMVDTVSSMGSVYEVYAPTEAAETMVALQRIVTVFGAGIVLILGLVSLLMVANTIRLSVYARRKEVNIMKFVGATDAFIRLPFMVEGVILGLLSALVAYAILWLGYNRLLVWFAESGSMWIRSAYSSIIPFGSVALRMAVGFGGAGVLIGMFGSMLFVRKHLRV